MKIKRQMSNGDILEAFDGYLEGELRSQRTRDQYTGTIQRFLDFSGKDWSDITKNDVDKWKRKTSGMAETSYVTHLSTIRQFLKFVYVNCDDHQKELEDHFKRVYEKTTLPKKPEAHEYKWLTYAEGMKLIEKTGRLKKNVNEWNWRIVVRLLLCGLRRGEVVGIRDKDVDLDRGIIHIPSSLAKHQHGRDVRPRAFFPYLIADLKDYRELNPPENEDAPFIRKRNGQGLHEQTIYNIVSRLSQEYIDRQVKVHALRHWSCTFLLWMGTPQREVQSHMGHNSLNDTDTYDHCDVWEGDFRDAEQNPDMRGVYELMAADKNRIANLNYERSINTNGNGHHVASNGSGNGDVESTIAMARIKLLKQLLDSGKLTTEGFNEALERELG